MLVGNEEHCNKVSVCGSKRLKWVQKRDKEAKSQEVRDSVEVEMCKRAKPRMKKDGPSSTDDGVFQDTPLL